MADPGKANSEHQLPAQKAMKQTAKTDSERGEKEEDQDSAAPSTAEPVRPQRKGDAPVGTANNEGSSPYGDRVRKEQSQRDE